MAERKMGPRRDQKKQKKWERAVREQKRSGETVRGFCRENGLDERSFYSWRRELRLRKDEANAASLSAMAAVEIKTEDLGEQAGIEVEVGNGRVVRVQRGFDEETFRRVVSALEAKRC